MLVPAMDPPSDRCPIPFRSCRVVALVARLTWQATAWTVRMGAMALLPLALSTAGEASEALPFGLSMGELQTWTLVYLGLSSLAFVVVWVVGYLRR